MKRHVVTINFEQNGSQLSAVEIGHSHRGPRVVALHAALFALGIVVCSYHLTTTPQGYVERVVMSRSDGGAIDGPLIDATRAAILPIALRHDIDEAA